MLVRETDGILAGPGRAGGHGAVAVIDVYAVMGLQKGSHTCAAAMTYAFRASSIARNTASRFSVGTLLCTLWTLLNT